MWVIKKRVQLLGLAQPWPATRRTWTADEMALLEQYAGQRHVNVIAKCLKRPIVSVVLKLKRMKLRRRVTEGYTLRDVQEGIRTALIRDRTMTSTVTSSAGILPRDREWLMSKSPFHVKWS